ncbi:YhjD/YihY/BrkB family envelope integrity protein [Pseudokineococcus marinus]|uniref:Glycosyl transferase n=1 Tax=Pseudokineococcus marinus TaxID=351215 RepID=A0A849BHT8_9ACTN|nr:YhjD/YihY/BrkB family envelope integrity protein [Pseudokineococcus marinus]NNH22131.1 glycosyl transferase [Pseudokineococcus marinus]
MPVAPSRPPERGLTRREVLRRLPGPTRQLLRRRELPLTAAGLTFYGALAAVPSVLIAVRVAGWLVGEERVLALGASLQAALPSAMSADVVARSVVVYGLGVAWPVVIFSLFPASLYGEGLRRAYTALGGEPPAPGGDEERGSRWLRRLGSGWRARASVLPVLAAAPLLLLVVLGVTPLVADLFSQGARGTALGVYVALNVDWVVISLPLAWTFRTVAPQHLSWRAALAGGFATGAFVAGFVQGIVLFVALPVDIGAPFGGSAPVGGVIAALLWLWLLHVVVLVGFAATLSAVRLRREG